MLFRSLFATLCLQAHQRAAERLQGALYPRRRPDPRGGREQGEQNMNTLFTLYCSEFNRIIKWRWRRLLTQSLNTCQLNASVAISLNNACNFMIIFSSWIDFYNNIYFLRTAFIAIVQSFCAPTHLFNKRMNQEITKNYMTFDNVCDVEHLFVYIFILMQCVLSLRDLAHLTVVEPTVLDDAWQAGGRRHDQRVGEQGWRGPMYYL